MTLVKQPLPTAPRLNGCAALSRGGDWQRTAQRAASALRRHLPSPDMLTGEQEDLRSRLLFVEPDGTFSIQATVWPPGRATRIHDHVTWCVFGVIQGVVDEEQVTSSALRYYADTRQQITGDDR